MSVFTSPLDHLKVLVLWAGQRQAADQLCMHLRAAVASQDIEVRTILEYEAEPVFTQMSKENIEAADCYLMLAKDSDWDRSLNAVREFEYYESLVRNSGRRSQAFRFIKFGGHRPPEYHAAGRRPLSAFDPSALTEYERRRLLAFFQSEAQVKSGMQPKIPLNKEMLEKKSGLLAATLWMITLDPTLWEFDEAGENFSIPKNALTGGLKYLKALHSIHAGLGTKLQGVMSELLSNGPSPDGLPPGRVRRQLYDLLRLHLPPYSQQLEENLIDCVGEGLIPALEALRRRLEDIPATEEKRVFLSACQERLEAILSDDADLSDNAKRPAGWWVGNYESLVDLIDDRTFRFLLDDAAEELLKSATTQRARRLRETAQHARNLHVATLQLTFVVLAVFSFLQGHRRTSVEELEVEKMEMIIVQLEQDWANSRPADLVVTLSNALIRDHLSALEDYEAVCNAAV